MSRQERHAWRLVKDQDNQSECENPHPVRLGRNAQHLRDECRERRDAIDQGKDGYLCPGGETHFYTTWVLWDGNSQGDWFHRYKDAVAERDRLNAPTGPTPGKFPKPLDSDLNPGIE